MEHQSQAAVAKCWPKCIASRAPGPPHPPLGPISVIFMQFSAKILPKNGFLPQTQGLGPRWEILDPPLKWKGCLMRQSRQKNGNLGTKLSRKINTSSWEFGNVPLRWHKTKI